MTKESLKNMSSAIYQLVAVDNSLDTLYELYCTFKKLKEEETDLTKRKELTVFIAQIRSVVNDHYSVKAVALSPLRENLMNNSRYSRFFS